MSSPSCTDDEQGSILGPAQRPWIPRKITRNRQHRNSANDVLSIFHSENGTDPVGLAICSFRLNHLSSQLSKRSLKHEFLHTKKCFPPPSEVPQSREKAVALPSLGKLSLAPAFSNRAHSCPNQVLESWLCGICSENKVFFHDDRIMLIKSLSRRIRPSVVHRAVAFRVKKIWKSCNIQFRRNEHLFCRFRLHISRTLHKRSMRLLWPIPRATCHSACQFIT